MTTVEERFWSKVDKSGDCWQWTAAKFRKGYGQFRYEGKGQGAHRVAYILSVGTIPAGMRLDHTCHTRAVERGECVGGDDCPHRACVNPDHLELVTEVENNLRGNGPAARHARKTHCPQGHPLSGDNLYAAPRGNGDTFRSCRACHNEASGKWHAKKRAEKAALPPVPQKKRELRTHCSRGHLYAGDNLYLRTDGKRECRTCIAAAKEARRTRDSE